MPNLSNSDEKPEEEEDNCNQPEQERQENEELRQQFLNNHISTIEEDYYGENLPSEFSTNTDRDLTQTPAKIDCTP